MYSEKFTKFIQMWQKEFAIERTIDEKICVDKDLNPIPWYTYPAIEYLSQFDYSQKRIYEFGCGNSSLFWARRAKQVISIEDNPEWFKKWQENFSEPNLDIRWIDEGPLYSDSILSEEQGFDVIVVDGKRRTACAQSAIQKINPGGMIILDDSDRVNTSDEYEKAIKILKEADLLQVDFYGFCPMNNYTKTTSIFFKRDFNFQTKAPIQPINGLGNLWSMCRCARKKYFKAGQ